MSGENKRPLPSSPTSTISQGRSSRRKVRADVEDVDMDGGMEGETPTKVQVNVPTRKPKTKGGALRRPPTVVTAPRTPPRTLPKLPPVVRTEQETQYDDLRIV